MLKVLFISSEVSPYAKSGGLGDVAGSLPKALKNMGVDVRVVFPKYKTIKPEYTKSAKYIGSYKINLEWREQSASVYQLDSEVTTYVIENDYYFTNRDGYYGYGDDGESGAYLYYPPSLPWQRTENDPQTLEEVHRRIIKAVQRVTDLTSEAIEVMIDDDLYVVGIG